MAGLGKLALVCGFAATVALVGGEAFAAQTKSDPLTAKQKWTKTFGDWTVTCVDGPDGKRGCSMAQVLASSKNKSPVATWSIGTRKDGTTQILLRTPSGVLLPRGLTVRVDKETPFSVPYRSCVKSSCSAVHELSQPLVTLLARSTTATVEFTTLREKPVSLAFSLRGFTKAYQAFREEAAR